MGNRINIGGRIHSTEVGNVALGANEVLDDTKGKKQNVINAETDAELLRLENEKQDNLTFDQAPTEDSTNPVTSGGVYAADAQLQAAIEAILLLIPSAASALNKLADQAFVNSSVATNTATFRGTYNSVVDLHLAVDATHAQIEAALDGLVTTADNNDYCYVQIPVSATSFDIEKTERYKFNGTNWKFEYQLNNSGFTAAQWNAINSGITAALVGDIDVIKSLIPSEATSLNKLADKAYVLAQIIAAIPAFKGQFETLAELQAVASPKAGDLGIVRTKDSDGYDVFTFYQYLNNAWNVFYTLSHHLLRKPASTGTTGDYPYNGMGRVVIPKNMVNIAEQGEPENIVNLLTQDAFEDGEGNPLTDTVFVIQYDFVLGEDINVPANCILEFDGGSFSGAYTITGQNTTIEGEDNILSTSVLLDGTFKNEEFNVNWFDHNGDITIPLTILSTLLNSSANQNIGGVIVIEKGTYSLTQTITLNLRTNILCKGGSVTINCTLPSDAPAFHCYNFDTQATADLHISNWIDGGQGGLKLNGNNSDIAIYIGKKTAATYFTAQKKFKNINISAFKTALYYSRFNNFYIIHEDIIIWGCNTGVEQMSGEDSNSGISYNYIKCWFSHCLDSIIKPNRGGITTWNFDNCAFEFSGKLISVSNNASSPCITIVNSYFERLNWVDSQDYAKNRSVISGYVALAATLTIKNCYILNEAETMFHDVNWNIKLIDNAFQIDYAQKPMAYIAQNVKAYSHGNNNLMLKDLGPVFVSKLNALDFQPVVADPYAVNDEIFDDFKLTTITNCSLRSMTYDGVDCIEIVPNATYVGTRVILDYQKYIVYDGDINVVPVLGRTTEEEYLNTITCYLTYYDKNGQSISYEALPIRTIVSETIGNNVLVPNDGKLYRAIGHNLPNIPVNTKYIAVELDINGNASSGKMCIGNINITKCIDGKVDFVDALPTS